MQELFLDFAFSPDNISADLRTSASGEKISVLNNNINFRTELKLRGNISPDLSWHNFDLELLNFRTDSFIIKKQNFNISQSENTVKIIKTKARDPFDLYAEYDTDSRIITVNGKAENYRPSKYVKYYKNSSISGILKSVYSGSAVFSYSLNNKSEKSFTYSSDITVIFDNSIIPFRNRVKSVFSGNSDIITVADFTAETEKGNIEFRGFYDLVKNLPEGHLSLKK